MKASMKGWAIVCLLGLVGCTYERYDDCESDYEDDDGFGSGASSHAGKAASTGGSDGGGTTSGGTSSGGTAGTGATTSGGTTGTGATTSGGSAAGAPPEPLPTCAEERDCDPGYNCDIEVGECQPSDQETCAELESESACSNRRDCETVYGGINCSCGADCECQGGEPGCVCESFDFLLCRGID
ncbi:MAG: hypothetical protein EOO73_31245 [Myxococcales bacterium]|nr:MAG: hypothetical protein EOO73_31245 [Myxococcales bacterium]